MVLTDALLGLEDTPVLSVDRSRTDRITVVIATGDTPGWCPGCGADAEAHDRRTVTPHDVLLLGFSLVPRLRKLGPCPGNSGLPGKRHGAIQAFAGTELADPGRLRVSGSLGVDEYLKVWKPPDIAFRGH